MFGISLFELLVIAVVMVLFIKPKDIPTVVKSVTRAIMKIKKFINHVRAEFSAISTELGLDDIKKEVEKEMIMDQDLDADDKTTIVDIYGQEHQVDNLSNLREDMKKEELQDEVKKYNDMNQNVS